MWVRAPAGFGCRDIHVPDKSRRREGRGADAIRSTYLVGVGPERKGRNERRPKRGWGGWGGGIPKGAQLDEEGGKQDCRD